MFNNIVLLLSIVPMLIQALILWFLFRDKQHLTKRLKLLFYGISLLNGITVILFGLLLGYLADERMITSSIYMMFPIAGNGMMVLVSLLKI